MNKSLYIHIPFCKQKCNYCDFYSIAYDHELAAEYIDILCYEIKRFDRKFETIYIGGGTPSVLAEAQLIKLLTVIKQKKDKVCEFTVEVNPESFNSDLAKLFFRFGINRLSIGLQSINNEKLAKLNRIHNAKQGLEAIDVAHKAGFVDVGVDCIFGVWGESEGSWRKEIRAIAKLLLTHISPYSLTYEKSTPLYRKVQAKMLKPVSDNTEARMYEYAMSCLPKKGFLQYEVSNFSKNGYQCRHNNNYWQGGDCWAVGASAVSYV